MDLFEFLDEMEARERENLSESKKYAGINSCGAGMAMGALDAIQDIREFLKDNNPERGE